MISQLDPMIKACKGAYYEEKRETIGLIREMEELSQSKGGDKTESISKDIVTMMSWKGNVASSFFECTVCNKLITTETFTKVLESTDIKMCYECFIQQNRPEDLLKDDLKTCLKKIIWQRLRNFRHLRSLRTERYLVTLTSSGTL